MWQMFDVNRDKQAPVIRKSEPDLQTILAIIEVLAKRVETIEEYITSQKEKTGDKFAKRNYGYQD
jgi:hypothetical protein